MKKVGSLLRSLTLFVAALVFLVQGSLTMASASQVSSGKIVAVGGVEHDWGFIDIKGGNLKHRFTLLNTGKQDLILKGGFTSCGCTKVKFTLADGSVSPEFGMSLMSDWVGVVRPGESFDATATFDPLAHGPDALGPVVRKVYVVSSAPPDGRITTIMPIVRDGSVTTMQLSGNIVSPEEFRSSAGPKNYEYALGNFKFRETEHDLGRLKQSQGIVKFEFPFVYDGKEAATVTGTPTSCGCTTASVSVKTLKPGQEGVLMVEFDPNFHEEPAGKFFRTISILTDPPQKERAEVRVWAEIDKDLGHEAYKHKEHDD